MSRHLRPTRNMWAGAAVVVGAAIIGTGVYLYPTGSETPTTPDVVAESPESPSASLPVPSESPSSRPTVTVTEKATETVTAPSKTKTATAPAPTVTKTKPGPTHTVTVPVTKTPTPKPPATSSTPKPNPTYGSGMNQYEVDVLALVWKERAKVCSGQIASDPVLNTYARDWSAHMSATRSMVHSQLTFPGRTRGENIAYGQRDAAEVMSAWMNSPGHRANILNCGYTKIGIGYVASGNYWTQVFAS